MSPVCQMIFAILHFFVYWMATQHHPQTVLRAWGLVYIYISLTLFFFYILTSCFHNTKTKHTMHSAHKLYVISTLLEVFLCTEWHRWSENSCRVSSCSVVCCCSCWCDFLRAPTNTHTNTHTASGAKSSGAVSGKSCITHTNWNPILHECKNGVIEAQNLIEKECRKKCVKTVKS